MGMCKGITHLEVLILLFGAWGNRSSKSWFLVLIIILSVFLSTLFAKHRAFTKKQQLYAATAVFLVFYMLMLSLNFCEALLCEI